jgi:aldehyde dehydrogenase (NAD+)
VGEMMTNDKRVPLISATGSIRMGKIVCTNCSRSFGKIIIRLGGNNAIIVTPDADNKMTVIGAVFGAVGTAGQDVLQPVVDHS